MIKYPVINMPNKKFPFLMGADPEFNIIMQNKRVAAKQTFQHILDNKTKFLKSNMGYKIAKGGNIGWDGADSTGEIRPLPADTPAGLIKNLHTILKETVKHMQLFDFSTLSKHASIGGHIHLELEDPKPSAQVIQNRHKKLTSFYLPIMMSENKINIQTRINSGYGKIKDYHEGAKESANTYELRTPSAEWLTTPKIAEATLAYLATIWHEIITHPKNFMKCKDILYKTEKQGEALQALAIADFETLTKLVFFKIRKYVKTFHYYTAYKQEIDYILKPQKILEDKRKVNFNIIEGWKLIQKKMPTKRELMSKKQFKLKAEKINLDQISDLVNVTYNNDSRINIFAKALSEKVAAFNWKLQNTYYLFGIRKGLEHPFIMDFNNDKIYLGHHLIATKKDKETIQGLFEKMTMKFKQKQGLQTRTTKFDSEKDINEKNIIIGIPYLMRMREETNKFIELIYKLEKKNIKPIDIMDTKWLKKLKNDCPVDREIPIEKCGQIYQIFNKKQVKEQEGIAWAENNEETEWQRTVANIERDRQTAENVEQEENERRALNSATTTPNLSNSSPTPPIDNDNNNNNLRAAISPINRYTITSGIAS